MHFIGSEYEYSYIKLFLKFFLMLKLTVFIFVYCLTTINCNLLWNGAYNNYP